MKKILPFLIVLCSLKASASHTTYEYIGTLTLDEGGVLTYKLVIEENDNYFVSGYSITDIYGENFTKTSIMGSFDKKKKNFSYNELNNLKKKEGEEDSTFCFVEANKLSIKSINGIKVMSGRFEAFYPSGELGASGDLFLLESNSKKKIDLQMDSAELSSYITNKIPFEKKSNSHKKPDSIQTLQENIKLLTEKRNLVMVNNEQLLVNYSKNGLKLEVWDGAELDGDSIRVFLNDNVLEEAIRLKKKKQTIELPDNLGYFTLKVEALNNGSSGVNTVNFMVSDNKNTNRFTSRLNVGESFETIFKKNNP